MSDSRVMNRLACTTRCPACERASLDKCSHCTLFTFRWFQCLVPLWALCTFRTRHTPLPHIPLPLQLSFKPTRTCFIARTMLAITFLSSITMAQSSGVSIRLSSRCQHISVIYIDKVNGMECVCARCWLDFNSYTDFHLRSDYPISNPPTPFRGVQKFAFLATTSHATPGSCIQRVALKGSPRMFPFMSSNRVDCSLRAHMQFLWLVRHRNGLLLKASHAPPSAPQLADKQAAFLPFPFLFFKGVSLFFLGNSRAEMKCA